MILNWSVMKSFQNYPCALVVSNAPSVKLDVISSSADRVGHSLVFTSLVSCMLFLRVVSIAFIGWS